MHLTGLRALPRGRHRKRERTAWAETCSMGRSAKPQQPKAPLSEGLSAVLRDQLTAEIANLTDGDALALWAYRRLPAKRTPVADDACAGKAATRKH